MSLFCIFVNYGRKSFITLAPGGRNWQLIYLNSLGSNGQCYNKYYQSNVALSKEIKASNAADDSIFPPKFANVN